MQRAIHQDFKSAKFSQYKLFVEGVREINLIYGMIGFIPNEEEDKERSEVA